MGAANDIDELTLARVRRGDASACRVLVERYERPVFAVLGRMTGGHRALVEDLAQETFLRVFRHIDAFDPRGPATLSTWIVTIATRLAIDERRRVSRRFDATETMKVPDDDRRTEGMLQARSDMARIESVLAEMPAEFRAAFVLRAYHDLGHDEIAHALSCEVGTVKSRIARTKARLQEALGLPKKESVA